MSSEYGHTNSKYSCSLVGSGRAWLSRSSSGASTPNLAAASSSVMSSGSTWSCEALASARARSTSGGSGSSSLLPFLGTEAAPATTGGGGCNPARPGCSPTCRVKGEAAPELRAQLQPRDPTPYYYTPLPSCGCLAALRKSTSTIAAPPAAAAASTLSSPSQACTACGEATHTGLAQGSGSGSGSGQG